MGTGLNFTSFAAKQMFKGDVTTFDSMVGVENEDAIGSRIKQGIQSLFFVTNLSIEARIEYGNSSLVGEGLQELLVVGGKQIGITAENEDDADNLSMGGEGDTDAIQ